MLVTCYYNIYPGKDGLDHYLKLFTPIGRSGLPIVLFVDPSHVHHFADFPFTVKVIPLALADLELYQIAMKFDRDLPSGRTPEKDTKEFFGLMNTKIEFVKKAAEIVKGSDDSTFMWCDFGILKIAKNPERFVQKLKEIQSKTYTKMTIPGCWSFGRSFTPQNITWRFCGGFFVIPKSFIDTFYNHCKGVLTDFCNHPTYCLTWETNIWAVIECCAEKTNMVWYFADHNDTIVTNIDKAGKE